MPQKEEDTNSSAGDPPRKKPTRLAIGKGTPMHCKVPVFSQSSAAAWLISFALLFWAGIPGQIQTSCVSRVSSFCRAVIEVGVVFCVQSCILFSVDKYVFYPLP